MRKLLLLSNGKIAKEIFETLLMIELNLKEAY